MLNKKIYLLITLVIASLLIFLGFNSSTIAAIKDGAQFEDWTVQCEKNENNQAYCYLTQSLANNNKVIATMKIGYFSSDKKLQALYVTPFGSKVLSGLIIKSNEINVTQASYATCYNYGCLAVSNFDENYKKLFENDLIKVLGIVAETNKEFQFNFSSKGLKKGLEAIK